MNRMIVKSRIGADGILHVEIPVGADDADREVRLTIEPIDPSGAIETDWKPWVEAMAGSISDPTFFRHHEGEFEQREALH